jgi:hypothetical protein
MTYLDYLASIFSVRTRGSMFGIRRAFEIAPMVMGTPRYGWHPAVLVDRFTAITQRMLPMV